MGPTTMVDPRLANIVTPLCLASWSRRLRHHPDNDFTRYILRGIELGFHIGADPSVKLKSASKNMLSALQHPEIIDEYLEKEVQLGNILGPFSPATAPVAHINRFGVIPKKHQPGKWRLITDLSYPEGASVNDSIDPLLCSLKYITVEQVARKAICLGKGSLIAKIDIKSAYRLIPVSPQDRHYQGMQWKDKVYIDGMLPFGLRSAPKIFNAVADALEWCIAAEGVEHIYHYLDDFAVLGPVDSEQCGESLGVLKAVCNDLGIPLAPEKQAGPSSEIEFLGIIIDTTQQELRLPEEKLTRLKVLGEQWKSRSSCTKRELESLLGTLQHACSVIPAGKAFLRQVIALLNVAKQPHHHIRLNKNFRADLTWWRVFARHWNGHALISGTHKEGISVTSDASGAWGCGAWSESKWFQLAWGEQSKHFQIAIKELIPVMIASFLWGRNWRGYKITVYCDNEAVVCVLNNRYSRDCHLAHMLRILFFVEAYFQCKVEAKHIPGTRNTLADHLSRNRLDKFHAEHTNASTHPSHVPLPLLQWLLDPQMDWTSERWIQLFNTSVSRE